MNHIDLFSGIGGFAIAVDEVWPGSTHTFCEIDQYCQALLKKRYPGSKIYGDIRTLTNANIKTESALRVDAISGSGVSESSYSVDLLTGGFPCQPFSHAGKRRGTSDNRFLWPEMLRVIREFRPTWVIAENVRGILSIEQGMVFEQVCLDLENEGYEVQPLVIPAVALNAPHRRDRVWFVAHSRCKYGEGSAVRREPEGTVSREEATAVPQRSNGDGREGDAPIASSPGLERAAGAFLQKRGERFAETTGDATNANDDGPQRMRNERDGLRPDGLCHRQNAEWEANWLEVAKCFCGVDAEFSAWLDESFNIVVTEEDYCADKKDRTEGVRILREVIQQKDERGERIRGLFKVSEKEVLLPFLFHIEKTSIESSAEMESAQNEEAKRMRELWHNIRFASPSYRPELNKQFAQELTGLVPELSRKTALCFAEIWNYCQNSYSSMLSQAVELDGLKLSKSRHRVERLKALGNAIVPAVAVEIMKAIKKVDDLCSEK